LKYSISRLPQNAADFNEMLPDLCTSPMGAAAACLMALNILAGDQLQGEESIRSMNSGVSNSILQLALSQLRESPYLIHSCLGTSPENGYSLPEKLEIEFTTNIYSGTEEQGRMKLFIACSGADSPRPVTVVKGSDGRWYADEFSSLIVGIRPPLEIS
jgi:hypothetical protein